MNRYGLTEERYNQLMELFGSDEEVAEIVKEWTVDVCNKGYDIFDFNGTGMLEIEKIDILNIFEDDEAASLQAIKDGIKLIPVDELPKNFTRRYLGWVDTPENRKTIEEYCRKIEIAKKDFSEEKKANERFQTSFY